MNEDDDLYGDLSTETTSDYIKKLEDKVQDYNEKIYELKKKVDKLKGLMSACQRDKDNLSRENEVLKRNISTLFNTAKNEVLRKDRKDKLISELHVQYEDLHFRRTKTNIPNSKRPEEQPESYPQHRYKSSKDVEYNSFNRNSRHGRKYRSPDRQAYDNRDQTDVHRDQTGSRSSNEKRTSDEKTDGSRRRPVSSLYRRLSPNQKSSQVSDKHDKILSYCEKTESTLSNEKTALVEQTDGSRRRPVTPQCRPMSANLKSRVEIPTKPVVFRPFIEVSSEKTDPQHRPRSSTERAADQFRLSQEKRNRSPKPKLERTMKNSEPAIPQPLDQILEKTKEEQIIKPVLQPLSAKTGEDSKSLSQKTTRNTKVMIERLFSHPESSTEKVSLNVKRISSIGPKRMNKNAEPRIPAIANSGDTQTSRQFLSNREERFDQNDLIHKDLALTSSSETDSVGENMNEKVKRNSSLKSAKMNKNSETRSPVNTGVAFKSIEKTNQSGVENKNANPNSSTESELVFDNMTKKVRRRSSNLEPPKVNNKSDDTFQNLENTNQNKSLKLRLPSESESESENAMKVKGRISNFKSMNVHFNNESEIPSATCGVNESVKYGNGVKNDLIPRTPPESESVVQKMVREAKRTEPELSTELIRNATPLLPNVENAIQYIKEHGCLNTQSFLESESVTMEKVERDYELISIKLKKNAAPKLPTGAGETVQNHRPLLQNSESATINGDPKSRLIKITPENRTIRNLKPPFTERAIQHQEMVIGDFESESEKIQSILSVEKVVSNKSITTTEQTVPQPNSQLLPSNAQTAIKHPHYTPLKFINGEPISFPFRLPKPMSPMANTPDYLKERFHSETNKISPVIPMINENRILDKPVVPMKEQNEQSSAKADHVDPVGSNNESSTVTENHVNRVISVKNRTPYKNCGVLEITSSCVMNSEAAENTNASKPVLSFTHDFEQGEFSRKGRKRPQIAIRYSAPKIALVDCS